LRPARIKLGVQRELRLGHLDARRDWGFAGDYVDAMWRMLQEERPSDFVIATGRTHSIRDLLDVAFGHLDLDWHDWVVQDPALMRPAEVELLLGDAARAREVLDWVPTTTFEQLVAMMVDSDLATESRAHAMGAAAATAGATR